MSLYTDQLVGHYDTSKEPSSNLERWLCYMQDVEAPNDFILCSFYSCISAVLQRRVWKVHAERLCYPNTYMVFVAPPGIGKGRSISLPQKILADFHWDGKALPSLQEDGTPFPDDAAAFAAEKSVEDKKDELLEELIKQRLLDQITSEKSLADDLLFPMPADSNSLRALTSYIAKAVRTVSFRARRRDGGVGKATYSHYSAYIVLQEFGTLFKDRRETADIVTFLNQAWDSESYKHSTYEHGSDRIERICVSMLGGTTQETIRKLFGGGLLDQGLSARAIFIYDDELRFRQYPDETTIRPVQLLAYHGLRQHIRRLAHVYGQVTFTDECRLFLKPWWEEHFEETRINKNPRLDHYYARKLVHVIKLAMAIHFSEKLDRVVTLEEVESAMLLLNALEEKMHLALQTDNRSDTAATIHKLEAFICRQKDPISLIRIYNEFIDEVNSFTELKELLTTMTETRRIQKYENNKYGRVTKGPSTGGTSNVVPSV